MRIKKIELQRLIERFLFEQEEEAPPGAEEPAAEEEPEEGDPEEEVEEEPEDIKIEHELIYKDNNKITVIVTLIGGEKITVVIKDRNGNEISKRFSPNHLSAMLSRIAVKAKKEGDKKEIEKVSKIIKAVHTDIPDDFDDSQVFSWIKNKFVRYFVNWSKEIDQILGSINDKKSIK